MTQRVSSIRSFPLTASKQRNGEEQPQSARSIQNAYDEHRHFLDGNDAESQLDSINPTDCKQSGEW